MTPALIPIPAAGRWPADVELWRVELSLDTDTAAACRHLCASEIARMARYAQQADRVRFAVARSVLRGILGAHLGRDPAHLQFEVGKYGRPSLAKHPEWSFNVSHSGARVLVALSAVRAVGVDIEAIDSSLDWRALLDLVCAPGEARRIGTVRDFYRCWTAKEALLKATGAGIGEGLKSIDVTNSQVPPALRFASLDELDGYAGALAFGRCARCYNTDKQSSKRALHQTI
jgi:4'-phosphopantetheinyl transferase